MNKKQLMVKKEHFCKWCNQCKYVGRNGSDKQFLQYHQTVTQNKEGKELPEVIAPCDLDVCIILDAYPREGKYQTWSKDYFNLPPLFMESKK